MTWDLYSQDTLPYDDHLFDAPCPSPFSPIWIFFYAVPCAGIRTQTLLDRLDTERCVNLSYCKFCSYLGRKRLKEDEDWVQGSQSLVHVTYSYWTLGYLITLQGAQKLLEPNPLSKLLPVDEYIPIMFDKHPEWVTVAKVYSGLIRELHTLNSGRFEIEKWSTGLIL